MTEDYDSISLSGSTITIHENGLASRVKGTLTMENHHQDRALIPLLLADAMELDPDRPEDWKSVNLSWVVQP